MRTRPGSVRDRLIVALDFTTLSQALRLATRLQGMVRTVKIGSVLFTAEGPGAIQRLRRLGFEVMLDLKFFDIPSTVELSCRAAARHRVSLLTVHASGERAMLEAAVKGVREEATRQRTTRPRVLGVTVLTSVGGTASSTAHVLQLAQRALSAGCDGVVASAREARALRRRFGKRLEIVCPGIRPVHTGHSDQQRVTTPAEALDAGADRLVVGRPIAAATNPRTATQQLLQEMEENIRC